MYNEKIGTLTKKVISYDGYTVNIGKNITVDRNEITKVYYHLPSLTEAGSLYLSLNGSYTVYPATIESDTYLNFSKNDIPKVKKLITVLGLPSEELLFNPMKYKKPTSAKSIKKRVIICPSCKSSNIENIGNNRKKFSVGKAVGGAALTGSIGSLAGFIGKKGKTNKWHCKNCGSVFDL